MNLRISESQLRFRITRDETELLSRNGELAFSLNLGEQIMEYVIALTELEQPLALNVRADLWKLLVDRKHFDQLTTSLPSREGMEEKVAMNGAEIQLVLEVDVRRKQKA